MVNFLFWQVEVNTGASGPTLGIKPPPDIIESGTPGTTLHQHLFYPHEVKKIGASELWDLS
jgi:hypothetical protein